MSGRVGEEMSGRVGEMSSRVVEKMSSRVVEEMSGRVVEWRRVVGWGRRGGYTNFYSIFRHLHPIIYYLSCIIISSTDSKPNRRQRRYSF